MISLLYMDVRHCIDYIFFMSSKILFPCTPYSGPCVSGDLPKPVNVTFLSINMRNILQWSLPEDLQGAEITYTVQYLM